MRGSNTIDGPADVPDAGSCRGYDPREFCTGSCDRCAYAESSGGCRAEYDALRGNPECVMMTYGFGLCFASCVINRDAGFNGCLERAGGPLSSCACYERCVALQPPACQPLRRAFDRCVNERCAACSF